MKCESMNYSTMTKIHENVLKKNVWTLKCLLLVIFLNEKAAKSTSNQNTIGLRVIMNE